MPTKSQDQKSYPFLGFEERGRPELYAIAIPDIQNHYVRQLYPGGLDRLWNCIHVGDAGEATATGSTAPSSAEEGDAALYRLWNCINGGQANATARDNDIALDQLIKCVDDGAFLASRGSADMVQLVGLRVPAAALMRIAVATGRPLRGDVSKGFTLGSESIVPFGEPTVILPDHYLPMQ